MNGEDAATARVDLTGAEVEGPSRTRVMLLGSRGLSRELVTALQRLGAEVIVADRHVDAPLHRIANQSQVIDLSDTDELAAAIRWLQPKVVVTAADVVAGNALTAAAATGVTELVPGIPGARLAADPEAMRRLAADQLGLPTAPFWFVGSVDELREVAEQAGFPMVVKPVAGPAGDGQSVMIRVDDVEPAWRRAVATGDGAGRVLAESVVGVDSEVTLLVAGGTGPTGAMLDFCAPIGHRSIVDDSGRLVLESWQPHPMNPLALDAAKSIAGRVVRALGGRGLFGVDLLVCGDEVYFAGVTARPYDIAWLTLRTQRLSAFELQARAILGLAIDALMVSPGAARLVYSSRDAGAPVAPHPDTVAVLAEALGVPESDALVFGHHEGYPRRRLGVAVATAADVAAARHRAARISEILGKLWA